ncbi:hypothetical protein TUMSATVNIG1_24740 [Vibrio nigripulchritudo]|uniref:hypothetical protein n=1 Tax=Vibrio nigripulchritudo TaxID=28173 RepID=UPI00190E44A6|nr:hypothetical protein [Vibrio nigripulchritudo]BCL70512.1 hypothetical protein VNTUMSATTG_24490 [Vibrio nigripulchritudo]BDU31865.1 hypothetical protein TUMSATVNIG1_24740 [Vibrio nigripulchritudo]
MSTQPFIFGGNTGRSYQDIKRIREQAEALKPSGRISGGMSGFGDGLSALGRALLYRMTTDKADKLEEKGRQSFNTEFNQWANQPDFKSSEIVQQSQRPPSTFGGIDPRLVKMSSNSFATPGQQALMQMVLKRQMDASAPADPLKQVQLQKAQLELEKMRNPERTVIQGADGFNYYQDTGERVLPGVEIPNDPLRDIQLQKAQLELEKMQSPQENYRQVSGDTATEMGLDGKKFYNIAPDGKVSQIGGAGVNVNVGGFNESQAKAAGFADRMIQSENVLRDVEQAGTGILDNIASKLPGSNFMVSDDYKLYDQAQRDFINAVLRRESGAVISDQEFDNARKQYFPQPGDTTEVMEQKRRNRETAIFGIGRAAGGNYNAPQIKMAQENEGSLPQAGQVIGGYRFKGGDPGDQNNWEMQ